VYDSRPGVGGFQGEPQLAVGTAVEDRTQGEKLVNPVRTFVCQDVYGLGIGQPIARSQGVGCVLARAVTRTQRYGDSALGPGAGAVGQCFLGEEDGGDAFSRQPPCCPETGNSGSYDDGAGRGHGSNIAAGKRLGPD
jgi:hypothetical protein